MPLIATLVSSPADPQLTSRRLTTAMHSVEAGECRILAKEIAAEFPIGSAYDAAKADRLIRAALGDSPIDVAVLPSENRRKRLLLADMDSTIIGQECIDELADYAGLKTHVAAITEQAMRGEIPFDPALRARVALLKGLPVSVVDEVIAERIRLTPGARELVVTMRAAGAYTALVSGGFTLFTGPIRAAAGFHEDRANTLLTENGLLNGKVQEPILGKEAKRRSLLELRDRHGLAAIDTLAVGDGANDIDMIRAAGLGVAYRAKPKVAAEAHARIDHGDLTALLYIQGHSVEDFRS